MLSGAKTVPVGDNGERRSSWSASFGKGAGLGFADRAALLILQGWGAVSLLFLALVPVRFLPAEDAVILFAYSRNLAQHGAITYLSGGPHVEGATDFAWMVLLAAAERCGMQAFWCCAVANIVSLAGLGVVLASLANVRPTLGRVLAIAGAAGLCRQIFAAASGFAVLLDAFWMALLVLAVVRSRPAVAALAALAAALFRPDGVVFAIPVLVGLLVKGRGRGGVWTAILFVLPGLAYFVWRWRYFGELLPLPFVVKGDFHRDLGIFVGGSVRASLVPLLFTGAALAPVLRLGRHAQLWLVGVLVGLPTLFYWTMRLDQNVGSRFFYYLPTATAILLAGHWRAMGPARRAMAFRVTLVAWLALQAAPLYREWLTFHYMQFDRVKAIAEALGNGQTRGRMLTSEAGFLPFYSGWDSIDPWGLNTPEFAHRFFQPSDVERIGADLIVTHPDLSESCLPQPGWKDAYRDRSWPHMTRNLVEGARQSYSLWLTPYGSELYQSRRPFTSEKGDRECWFVRQGCALQGRIEEVLRDHGAVGGREAAAIEIGRRALAP